MADGTTLNQNLPYDMANSTTPTGTSQNLPQPTPAQLSADDIALAAQRKMDPSPPSAQPGPSATDLIAQEAQRRLGLSFTPDLTDPDMKSAITKAMDLYAKGGLNGIAPPDSTPQAPTEGPPVTSPKQVTDQMLKSVAEHNQADAEDIQAIIQNKIDPNGTYDPNNTANPQLRFLIGHQIGLNNWQDAEQELKNVYPNGDIYNLGGYPFKGDSDLYIYRESPDQPFKPLGIPGKLGEIDNMRNAANALSFGLSPEFGLWKTGALTGMATATGDYLDYLLNRFRGLSQNIDVPDAVKRAGESGEQAAIPIYLLGGVFKGIPAPLKYIPGISTLADISGTNLGQKATVKLGRLVKPTMVDLSNQATANGLEPLTIGQVGPNWAQQIARQAGALSGKMKEVKLAQMNSVRDKLENVIAQHPELATNPSAVQAMVDAERDQIVAELPAAKMGQSVTGLNLQSGVQAWRNNSKALVRLLGDKASTAAGDTWVGMPMKPLQEAAARVRIGVKAPGVEPGAENLVQLEPPTKLIQPYLQQIDKIGDRLGTVTDEQGVEHNAFDQFIALRDGLYDLKNNGPDTATRQQAYELWDATHRMLDNAESEVSGKAGAKYTKQFKDAFSKFVDTYKSTEDAADTLRSMLNARDPGGIARALTQPGKLKTLLTVKNALVGTPQEPAWDAVVNGFRSTLQEDLVKGGQTIRRMQLRDPEMLNAIIDRREQQSWLELAQAESDVRKSLAAEIASGNGSDLENAIRFAQKGSKEELAKYAARTGGTDGEFATSIRKGIWTDILNSAKKVDEKTGEESIDPHALNDAIRKYMVGTRRTALDPVMTQQDWDTMALLRRYSAVVGADVSSVGGSMQAGQVVSHMTDVHEMITNRSRVGLSILKMLNARLASDILASPVSDAMFTRALNSRNIPTALKLVAHAASYATQKDAHAQRQEPVSFEFERAK